MPKPDPNHPKLVNLCRQFIVVACEKAKAGSGLAPVGPLSWTDDKVLTQIRHMFSNRHGIIHFPSAFPTEIIQNDIAKEAFQRAGVSIDDVRQGLKNQGLKDLLTILGRAVRLG